VSAIASAAAQARFSAFIQFLAHVYGLLALYTAIVKPDPASTLRLMTRVLGLARERRQLDSLLTASLASMQQAHRTTVAYQYQKQLEQRIIELPQAIAQGISPEAIASKINESLRQQFVQSGLPQTAKALDAVSKQLKQLQQAAGQFQQTAIGLTGTYRGIAAQAESAINSLDRSIRGATETATSAAARFGKTFCGYRRALLALVTIALFLAFLAGWLTEYNHLTPTPEAPKPAPAVQTSPVMPEPPSIAPPAVKPKAKLKQKP